MQRIFVGSHDDHRYCLSRGEVGTPSLIYVGLVLCCAAPAGWDGGGDSSGQTSHKLIFSLPSPSSHQLPGPRLWPELILMV